MNANRAEAMRLICGVLAQQHGCTPEDFDGPDVLVIEFSGAVDPRRPTPAKPLLATTTGNGAVIACHAEYLEPVRELAAGLTRDRIFSARGILAFGALIAPDGAQLRGPYLNHVATRDHVVPVKPPAVQIELLCDEEVHPFANAPGFSNSLDGEPGQFPEHLRAAIARDQNGALIAAAAAAEEQAGLWQIGVDVLPEGRGQGLGLAVVSAVTEAIFNAGGVPYYAAAAGNIASRSIAHRLGFWPAWTAMNAR